MKSRFKPKIMCDWNTTIFRWWMFEFVLFSIKLRALLWKDKYASPRCERVPELVLIICNFEILVYFGDDDIWEDWLQKKYYNNGNTSQLRTIIT